MDISQLRTLVCVAEFGSLSKAADHLCTAQPALSRQVRLLEEELGARLFERHGRGRVLTEQGRVVLQHAARIMAEVEDIRFSVTDEDNALNGGQVSIGLVPTVSEILASPMLASLRQARPRAKIRIVSAYSLYLMDRIHRGEIDVAVLYDPHSIRSLRSEPLLEEDLYVVGPPGADLVPGRSISVASLGERPMLLPSAGHSLRQIVDRAAGEAGIKLQVMLEVDSYSILKQLVLSGVGCTVLPLGPVALDVAAARLCAAPLTDPPLRRVLELAAPADRPPSRLASFVQKTLVATASELVASQGWPGRMRTR